VDTKLMLMMMMGLA